MKLKPIDILLYVIGGVLGVIIFILSISYVHVHAAEAEPVSAAELAELEEKEVESLNDILECLYEMKARREDYETTAKMFMEKVKTILEMVEKFMAGESNVFLWFIALQAFQASLAVVLIFTVSWGKK